MASSSQASTSSLSSASFETFNADVQAAALTATRSAAGLPSDIPFHRSIDPALAGDLDAFSARVLTLTNNLLALVATADPVPETRRKGKARLQTQDDVVDDFHALVVDSVDQLLERTDICLDEFLGRTKAPLVAIDRNAPALRKLAKQHAPPRGQLDPALQHAAHLSKPQLAFATPMDNSDAPWVPALPHKYHARVPLGHVFRDADAGELVTHPYRFEITHLVPPACMLAAAPPVPARPFVSTTATWVATPAALESMLSALRSAPEIALDLEHHSYRSYGGMVCLMQVSTRDADWVVDALALRAELQKGALGEVFADPNIVKVLHGAESDIVWLQQDFNLYIVNLFDTFHASKVLDFPRHGLANLLEMYCDFVPDKRYQLADWRIRPLPEEMLEYARSDTHFLLFIYDNLRNALLDRAVSQSRAPSPSSSSPSSASSSPPDQKLLREVLARSAETALRTYVKEAYGASGPGGWDTLARKWNKGALLSGGADTLPRKVYRAVHRWRDEVAREEDESTRYVLPNHYLFQLAERPPADMAALLQVFGTSVPPVVRRRAKELLEAVRRCVKAFFAQTAAPVEVVRDVRPVEDAVMDVDGSADVKPPVGSSSLWSTDKASGKSVAAKSALFGASTLKAPATASLTAATSSLFGVKGKTPVTPIAYSTLSPRFQEVVARIHSALVIIPSMPVAKPTPAAAAPEPPADWMQVEVPFIPASQRTTKPKPIDLVVDDAIVVVGQARQKKRKRAAAAKPEPDADGEPEPSPKKAAKKGKRDAKVEEGEEADNAPFDYATVPNILDDVPNGEDLRVKKKKKPKKEKTMYGDFPAPPKAHSELKSGNQSHTFK